MTPALSINWVRMGVILLLVCSVAAEDMVQRKKSTETRAKRLVCENNEHSRRAMREIEMGRV